MGLKAIYDTLDDIPEPHRELYSERNGKFELSGIDGVKSQADVDRLQTALTKERDAHKAAKTSAEAYAALGKIEDLQARLDRIDELETAAAGKLDDEAINKLVEGRLRTKVAPLERGVTKLTEDLAERDARIAKYEERDRTRAIHDAVRAAALSSKVNEHAVEDVLLLAERLFEVDEEGRVSMKDNVGYTPGVDPVVWLTEIQPKRPHWWPPSHGGGARGGGNGGGSGPNPFSADGWNLTEQGKLYRENPTRAAQLAQLAGTTVGGPRPKTGGK